VGECVLRGCERTRTCGCRIKERRGYSFEILPLEMEHRLRYFRTRWYFSGLERKSVENVNPPMEAEIKEVSWKTFEPGLVSAGKKRDNSLLPVAARKRTSFASTPYLVSGQEMEWVACVYLV
jgi:hypothetical protein